MKRHAAGDKGAGAGGIRSMKTALPATSAADRAFRITAALFASLVLLLVVLMGLEMVRSAWPSIAKFGWRFLSTSTWDPVHDIFGAWPFLYGTAVSSILALVIAVPISIGIAVFIAELAPHRLRSPVALLVELLAAVPSVIFGLWGIFVMTPWLSHRVEPWLIKHLGWSPVFKGAPYGVGMLAAGFILALMILPIISSVSKEVLLAVPQAQREAMLALGATKWEVTWRAVIPFARSGILGAVILGLGRALGETMAVTMVIGNRPKVSASLLDPSYTISSAIANEFAEATGKLHISALVELGLILFVVTLIWQAIARLLVWSITRNVAVGRE